MYPPPMLQLLSVQNESEDMQRKRTSDTTNVRELDGSSRVNAADVRQRTGRSMAAGSDEQEELSDKNR